MQGKRRDSGPAMGLSVPRHGRMLPKELRVNRVAKKGYLVTL